MGGATCDTLNPLASLLCQVFTVFLLPLLPHFRNHFIIIVHANYSLFAAYCHNTVRYDGATQCCVAATICCMSHLQLTNQSSTPQFVMVHHRHCHFTISYYYFFFFFAILVF
ncbi:unnamed protein product [Ceratitis capitata]|uniref:(Mediterranean fruit fly) hypothetical protein n=1 Tax=Ceratitis capitata TaxID=7213 RepID=A0A811V8D1_CERCA|nr:unnamed protein product [Ceratitis capitata]